MGGWNKKTEIKKQKIILAEGNDAYYFCIWALEAYGIEDVQVLDFGGNEQLKEFLVLFKNFLPGSENVEKILILRDAEKDAQAAQKKIESDLINAGYHSPSIPFVFSGNDPQIAYGLFPGMEDEQGLVNGTLEDLCLATIDEDPLSGHLNSLISFLKEEQMEFRYPHKTKLHAYLSFRDQFVGMKLGEAARANAFNWGHPAMINLNKVLSALS
jgi:hypothetical protein